MTGASRKGGEVWILDGVLYTQDAERRTRRGHLRIIDGRIAEITSKRPSRISKNAEVVSATGLVVVPGFVQGHVHLCQTLFRNQADDLELLDWLSKKIWVMEAAHTAETLYTSAALGIYELLSSGTTCILDMGTVRHTESIYKAVRDLGIRASVGKCLMDHPTQAPEYLREPTDQALAEASHLFKKWNGKENDRIRVSYAPRFVLSCTEDLLRQVSKLSREQNAIIHTHASENLKETEWVRKTCGRENIEVFDKLGMTSSRLVLAHCIWLSSKEKEILRKSGTHAVHCPSSNLKLASGIAPIPELMKMGINVALGADGTPCNNNLNIFQEMRLAALIHKPGAGPRSMRAMEVMDMATRNGAKALGWLDDIGTIDVGKKADLVALDLSCPENSPSDFSKLDSEAIASAIVYSTQPQHVRWTRVDGRRVYDKGKVTGISKQALMARVQKAHRMIRKKIELTFT